MKSHDILTILSNHRTDLQRFGVVKLGLFGSYSQDRARPDSDLDFLVQLQPKTVDNLLGLKFYLEDLFGLPVDVVLEHLLRAELRPQVQAEVRYVAGL